MLSTPRRHSASAGNVKEKNHARPVGCADERCGPLVCRHAARGPDRRFRRRGRRQTACVPTHLRGCRPPDLAGPRGRHPRVRAHRLHAVVGESSRRGGGRSGAGLAAHRGSGWRPVSFGLHAAPPRVRRHPARLHRRHDDLQGHRTRALARVGTALRRHGTAAPRPHRAAVRGLGFVRGPEGRRRQVAGGIERADPRLRRPALAQDRRARGPARNLHRRLPVLQGGRPGRGLDARCRRRREGRQRQARHAQAFGGRPRQHTGRRRVQGGLGQPHRTAVSAVDHAPAPLSLPGERSRQSGARPRRGRRRPTEGTIGGTTTPYHRDSKASMRSIGRCSIPAGQTTSPKGQGMASTASRPLSSPAIAPEVRRTSSLAASCTLATPPAPLL